MVGEASKKRQRQDGYKRRHDRNKFRRTTNATVHRKDLGNGLKGFLLSCTPHHENHCFRDGVLLLSKFCEGVGNNLGKESEKKEQSLEDELKDLRSGEGKIFTRVDGGVTGAVFVKINNDKIDIERVVELALRDARQTGNPGSRHCIRLLPIYTTCYAKAEDAAKAAAKVVEECFPRIEDSPVTYAIAFRSRVNNSAKRNDFIPAVAAAVEQVEPRYKVNLTTPDVVLLVEVLKTSCCIGVFRHYYELAKMNLREAACPSKPKGSTGIEQSTENVDQPVALEATKGDTHNDHNADMTKTSEKENEESNVGEIRDSQKTDLQSEERITKTSMKGKESQRAEKEESDGGEAALNDRADDGASADPKGSENGDGEVQNNYETDGKVPAKEASEAPNDAEQVDQKT